MSFSSKSNEKINEKISIINRNEEKNFNEIKFIKRNFSNNTHEVIQDTKLKKITSWRKSKNKFFKNLILNILSLGILHLISLHYPTLYTKLYCNPCQPKDCDFFLVEDIYGYFTLCLNIHKKGNSNKEIDNDISITKQTFIHSNNTSRIEYYFSRNLTYSFKYKSMNYEYNEETNEIIPVYMNLAKITNKAIINYFGEGLSSEKILTRFKERYGPNEYYINLKLSFLYFLRVELPNFIIILINSLVEIILGDYISFAIKFGVVILVMINEYFILKKIIGNLFEKDYTLDGETTKIKVKRKHLMKDDNFYIEIKNADLVPGDIIFLKSNDIVPCDCLILEGECIANESNATGNLDIFRKKSLDNKNIEFNYKKTNISILLHGMKIMKTISKLKGGFISALCINTGANTFKANQYSNILYLSEKKNNYNSDYYFFGGQRKTTFISSIFIYFLSIILGSGYIFILHMKILKLRELLPSILIRTMCKSLMPTYYITTSIIIFLSVNRLRKENIFCYDKSRLLHNSGNINTIFFSKTGTLCENTFEVNGYHPVFINPKKSNKVNFKTYTQNQTKEMNIQCLDYYKQYLNIMKVNNNNLEFNIRKSYNLKKNVLNFNKKSRECMSLFLECLLSCNNLDKFKNEIFGNAIESAIFNEMKWDIKIKDSDYTDYNSNVEDQKIYRINTKNNFFYDNKFVIIDRKIYDIYPKNYYKVNENSKMENLIKTKEHERNSTLFLEKLKKLNKNELSKSNSFYLDSNYIYNDINSSKIGSYKLRIYKKFITNGTLNSSAIVYNFMTKELRFMTKGMAEDILENCDKTTLPENFSKTILQYRRNGFIIIICASKLINIDDFNDLHEYDYYLNNLTFCGFLTLKNKLKEKARNSLKDLKLFKCNTIISSGDNEYNCLSIGFDSGVVEIKKNVFVFDKEDNNNKIIIKRVYRADKKAEADNENNNENSETKSNYDKISKAKISKNSHKENSAFKYNNSIINTSNIKQDYNENKLIGKELKTPKIETKKIKSKQLRRNSYFDSTQITNNVNGILQNDHTNNNNTFALNSELYEINLNEDKNSKNKKYIKNRNIQDNNSHKKSRNSYYIYDKNSFNGEYEKFYYYPGIFKKHTDLIENCVYCVSGKVLYYLYKNKSKSKEYKNLLQQIYKNCRIFFGMTSFDKSLAIDFYKRYQNSYICHIGECHSDFDPIMTANVGIHLRKPKNFNTILCHFYSGDADIICLKKIILEGRIVDENIQLLQVSSYFCTMIINSYILTCFIRNTDVIPGQLNFLEILLFILSIMAFTGEPNNKYAMNPLVKNNKLFNCHYYFQIIGLLLLKLISIYFASAYYETNLDLKIEKVDKIFCTYYFILSIELIFSIIFSFNFISFSGKSFFSSSFAIIFTLLLFLYYINLIALNSSNFQTDFLKISYFEYNEDIIDCFDDKNRMRLILICSVDFCTTYLYSRIVYNIFYRIAEYKQRE